MQGRVETRQFYFVKVDVKSCFDSIPQAKILDLARNLLSTEEYAILAHSEVNSAEPYRTLSLHNKAHKPSKRYYREATVIGDSSNFLDIVKKKSSIQTSSTVYVDSVVPQNVRRSNITDLLNQHISANIVRIGKKYYRQKQGIPQGSILSSLLCNFFYGDFERQHLAFLPTERCALFRLIDDFLLVTTDPKLARSFLNIMHAGNPDYGISIKPEKTLVNFQARVGGRAVPRAEDGGRFPYCGMHIDTRTLDISKNWDASRHASMFMLLVINNNHSINLTRTRPFRLPNNRIQPPPRPHLSSQNAKVRPISPHPPSILKHRNFSQLTQHLHSTSALKIQMHTMLLDTSFNSPTTVLRNIHQIMSETASKSFQYLKCLHHANRASKEAGKAGKENQHDPSTSIILGKRQFHPTNPPFSLDIHSPTKPLLQQHPR